MTPEEIEGNKLIAVYDGYKLIPEHEEYYSHPDSPAQIFMLQDLNYHEDWSLLMPVVEKIEKTGCIVEMWTAGGKGCKIYYISPENKWVTAESNSFIEAVYVAVVEFIKWYNNQQKS